MTGMTTRRRSETPAVSRRDFLNGVSVALTGALLPTSRVEAFRLLQTAGDYPPTRTGLRGSHPGSFEAAHEMRDGRTWDDATPVERSYDLIVVGGGISGLSAAHFYRKRFGPSARILVLDNHDDFGGHAKRNEFWHDGRMYLMNGGTLNVEAPSQYGTVAAGLLWELGIDRTRYYESVREVSGRYRELGLARGMFFDRETFGEDRLVPGYSSGAIASFLEKSPLSQEARADVLRVYEGREDYLPGLDSDGKKARLAKMSYRDYLLQHIGISPEVVPFFNTRAMGLFCVGIDAVPALYGWEMGFPGFEGLDLEPTSPDRLVDEPGGQHGRESDARAGEGDPDMYFPDGNATIARLLVRTLNPGAVPGSTMEDVVTSRVDYGQLDGGTSRVDIRLGATAVRVENAGEGVRVTYVKDGRAYRVDGGASVLACWNGVIPYICPDVPREQARALLDGVKAPLVYTSVLLRNWRPFVDAGVSSVTAPGSYHTSMGLGPSLALGGYRTSQSPDEPIVVRMSRYPCSPGLTRREQHRVGRQELLDTTFETFEREIRDQLQRSLGSHGLDPSRDIVAITVNRWPHGYTYTYNSLYDPESWCFSSTPERPAIVGRRPVGKITIANSDAAASPHSDAAINEAYRAVSELAAGARVSRRG